MISDISSAAPAAHARSPRTPITALVVEADGHTISYTEVRKDTGEVTWRWPNEPMGQIVDIAA